MRDPERHRLPDAVLHQLQLQQRHGAVQHCDGGLLPGHSFGSGVRTQHYVLLDVKQHVPRLSRPALPQRKYVDMWLHTCLD